jgi:hypothetical protein
MSSSSNTDAHDAERSRHLSSIAPAQGMQTAINNGTQRDTGRHREQQRDMKFDPRKVLTKAIVGASGPPGPSAPLARSYFLGGIH